MHKVRGGVMEEDIKLLEETIKLKIEQGCKALECGVTKNNTKLRCEIIQLKNKIKEQEKIIKLMAQDIAENDIDEDICKKVGKNPFCDEYGEESKCVECVIEYYEKKARE
jgi:hypothetical protein